MTECDKSYTRRHLGSAMTEVRHLVRQQDKEASETKQCLRTKQEDNEVLCRHLLPGRRDNTVGTEVQSPELCLGSATSREPW